MTKKANRSEVEVMQEIDEAFAGLQPEARQRVLDWVTSKYELGVRSGTQVNLHNQRKPNDGHPRDIKSFMAEKAPGNLYQRVACLVYYLEKFGDMNDVGSADIIKANADARLPKMTNPSLFIQHATHTYAYLTSLGKRKFAISARGEAVVEALPSQEKVEEVHSRLPVHKRGKRAGKKAKG
jgi:hypothetical protein